MLGKFLYGKRFNIYYNPNIKAKKDNEISAYYKEEELARLDPKFYFRPVQMLERSRLALPQFREYAYIYPAYSKKISYTDTGRSRISPTCTTSSGTMMPTWKTARIVSN